MPNSNTRSFSQMAVLYFGLMAIGMGQTVVFAIIPMLGREIGLDELVITIDWLGVYYPLKELGITSLTSLAALVFFIAAPFWGRRSDVIGRKPVIIVGLLGYSVGTLIFNGVAHGGLVGFFSGFTLYLWLMAVRTGLVMLMAATQPAASAYVVDVTSLEGRTKGMSKLNMANQIGTMIGPALAYFAAVSFLAPLYIQAVVTLLAAVLIAFFLKDSPRSSVKFKPKRLRYLDPRFRVYLGIGVVMYTMMGMVQQTLGFYFQDKLQLDSVGASQHFSIAMIASSAMMLLTQFFVVMRWKRHPFQLLQLGLPLILLSYMGLAMAESFSLLIVSMAFFGLGLGLVGPGFSVSVTYTVTPEEQGALAGLSASAPAMGFVLGPLLGGAIYAVAPTLTYWCGAVVLMPLIIFVFKMKPQLS